MTSSTLDECEMYCLIHACGHDNDDVLYDMITSGCRRADHPQHAEYVALLKKSKRNINMNIRHELRMVISMVEDLDTIQDELDVLDQKPSAPTEIK